MTDAATFEALSRVADDVFRRADEAGFDRLRPEEKVFFCVWSAVGQIENGGFYQFYYNSSGDWALESARAFETIGAPIAASLTERGNSVFPDAQPPKDRTARIALLDAMGSEDLAVIDSLDDAFYQASEDFDGLLHRYASAHSAVFRSDGV